MTDNKISYYRSESNGELSPPHWIGETEDGRKLFQFIEGWMPVNSGNAIVDYECDESGNWIEMESE